VSVRRYGAGKVYYGDGFQHADPTALALVARDDETEWTLVRAERLAVDGVRDENGFGGEVVVEFSQGECGAVAVRAFGNDSQCHAFAP